MIDLERLDKALGQVADESVLTAMIVYLLLGVLLFGFILWPLLLTLSTGNLGWLFGYMVYVVYVAIKTVIEYVRLENEI